MEELRELSKKRISEQAQKNAEEYVEMYRKVARCAFEEGARWFASELAHALLEKLKEEETL